MQTKDIKGVKLAIRPMIYNLQLTDRFRNGHLIQASDGRSDSGRNRQNEKCKNKAQFHHRQMPNGIGIMGCYQFDI